MIYLDSSVALAHLLAKENAPGQSLWTEPLVSSRLLEYEVWNRLHAAGLARSLGEDAHALIARMAFLDLLPTVLSRALDPFPTRVRTLDALHLASIEFLREHGQNVELATYDDRMAGAARTLDIKLFAL